MEFRFSRSILLAAVAALGISRVAIGASFVSGTVSASDDTGTTTDTLSSIPYLTPAVAPTDATGNSTTSPDFTGLVFKTSFAQNIFATPDPTSGESDVTFTANTGDTYSLFGSSTLTGGASTFTVSLFDNSTDSSIYSESPAYQAGVATADTNGGPTDGTLQAGTYTFSISDSLSMDEAPLFASLPTDEALDPTATIAASGGITLLSTGSAPEPSSAAVLLLIAGAALPLIRRRRGVTSVVA